MYKNVPVYDLVSSLFLGCGKTMLMDMLYKNVDIAPKKRVHFNQFMIDVHKRIHQFKINAPPVNHRDKTSKPLDPIPPIAKDISDETWFLCFDEFQVRQRFNAVHNKLCMNVKIDFN